MDAAKRAFYTSRTAIRSTFLLFYFLIFFHFIQHSFDKTALLATIRRIYGAILERLECFAICNEMLFLSAFLLLSFLYREHLRSCSGIFVAATEKNAWNSFETFSIFVHYAKRKKKNRSTFQPDARSLVTFFPYFFLSFFFSKLLKFPDV